MMPTDNLAWKIANQNYLMAHLQLLREELLFYQSKESSANFQVSQESYEQLETAQEQLIAPAALDILVNAFQLSSFETKVLLLCTGVELQDDFGNLISDLQGNPDIVHPSFNLAMAAFSDAHWSAISPASPLRQHHLLHLNNGQIIAKSPLKIEENILHFLTGFSYLEDELTALVHPIETKPYLVASQALLVEQILQAFALKKQDAIFPVIQLEGTEENDKIEIAHAFSQVIGHKLYRIPAHAIPERSNEIKLFTRLWNRTAALNAYVLFLDAADINDEDKNKIQVLTTFINQIDGVLLVGDASWTNRIARPVLHFRVEKPSKSEQLSLWKSHLGKYTKYLEGYLEEVVAHFHLSTKTIIEASQAVASQQPHPFRKSKANIAFLKNTLWKSCCQYTRPKVKELAQYMEAVAQWEDLILPQKQKEKLRAIATQVKNRNKVYEEWGFASKSSRGFGISALFTGESGTGKTMAAEVLANELQLDLYRIDLSQVVNKYIGETEKNLKRIFDAAEAGGAILLFDEADALFGKRSDVKDSHDRYSNIEVSYLLQRMENYRGLAILTTNMKNAIDTAFLRRIRFVLHFAQPDIVLRAQIWKGVFPMHAPLSDQLSFRQLAQLNIAGGNIKNVAMNAAFLAASENQDIQMNHILQAAKTEYNKLEKTLSRHEIKNW